MQSGLNFFEIIQRGAIATYPLILLSILSVAVILERIWSLRDARGSTQIDCGYGDAPSRELWSRHFDTTLHGEPITRIVATHCHPDHQGAAFFICRKFGIPLACHEADVPAMDGRGPFLPGKS